jgi:hypothetical protein
MVLLMLVLRIQLRVYSRRLAPAAPCAATDMPRVRTHPITSNLSSLRPSRNSFLVTAKFVLRAWVNHRGSAGMEKRAAGFIRRCLRRAGRFERFGRKISSHFHQKFDSRPLQKLKRCPTSSDYRYQYRYRGIAVPLAYGLQAYHWSAMCQPPRQSR